MTAAERAAGEIIKFFSTIEPTRKTKTIEIIASIITSHMGDGEDKDSPTWPYVLAFAKRMEEKLARNRHKGDRAGWVKDTPQALLERIKDETQELGDALNNGGMFEVINEAADIANFAMMVADSFTQRAIDAERKKGTV